LTETGGDDTVLFNVDDFKPLTPLTVFAFNPFFDRVGGNKVDAQFAAVFVGRPGYTIHGITNSRSVFLLVKGDVGMRLYGVEPETGGGLLG
jgi:hypothetical protein